VRTQFLIPFEMWLSVLATLASELSITARDVGPDMLQVTTCTPNNILVLSGPQTLSSSGILLAAHASGVCETDPDAGTGLGNALTHIQLPSSDEPDVTNGQAGLSVSVLTHTDNIHYLLINNCLAYFFDSSTATQLRGLFTAGFDDHWAVFRADGSHTGDFYCDYAPPPPPPPLNPPPAPPSLPPDPPSPSYPPGEAPAAPPSPPPSDRFWQSWVPPVLFGLGVPMVVMLGLICAVHTSRTRPQEMQDTQTQRAAQHSNGVVLHSFPGGEPEYTNRLQMAETMRRAIDAPVAA